MMPEKQIYGGTRMMPEKQIYGGTRMMPQQQIDSQETMMPEQHLYLVFDDWDSGYSVRKVSLSRRSGEYSGYSVHKVSLLRRSGKRAEQPLSSGSGKQGVEPLPGVFMHIRAERGYPDLFTSAFGRKIMVMAPETYSDSDTEDDTKRIPVIDVREQALTFGPRLGYGSACPIFFPVGINKLFALDISTFECYFWTPGNTKEPWEWQDVPYPPFKRADVDSYGVLPDGCIIVSTVGCTRSFLLDTNRKEYVWRPFGKSVFPFAGCGHYDRSLPGFVGLSKDGYLCCCTANGTHVKRSKEKVYTERQHVSATLLQMDQGKFCLVECLSADNRRTGEDLHESWVREFKVPLGSIAWDCVGGGPQDGRCMYCIKIFNISYDSKEDCLKLENKGQDRCYSLPHEARIGSVCMDPMAFWL